MTGFLAFCCALSGALLITAMRAVKWGWYEPFVATKWRLPYGAFLLPPEAIAIAVWLVPTIAMVLVYLVLLYKGTRGARYANR